MKEKKKSQIKNPSNLDTNQPVDTNDKEKKDSNIPPSQKDIPNKLEDSVQLNEEKIIKEQNSPPIILSNPINQSENPIFKSKNESAKKKESIENELLEDKIISGNNNNILEIDNEEYIPSYIGKLCFDPLTLFVYNSKNNSFHAQKFEYSLINFDELNNTSTCCNGDNKLFVSGGIDKDGKIVDKLWIFNLINYNVEEPILINGKHNHSMIYIPKKYIFFVGGNDENVSYYDINEKKIEKWGTLNQKRIEPALIVVDNYLYAFDNINKDEENNIFELSFERTNLLSSIPKWELISPLLSRSVIDNNNNVIPKFFGICKESNESIIFLGGNIMDENDNDNINFSKNYKYNIEKNSIEITFVHFINISLKEKKFLPFNDKKDIYFILPDFYNKCPQVAFYIKNKNSLKVINYKPNYKKDDKKIIDIEQNINKENVNLKYYDFNMPKIPEKIHAIVEN